MEEMEEPYGVAAGLDVHKETVVASVVSPQPGKKRLRAETCTFEAHARGLRQLREWLLEKKVEAVVMEGTGVYWRPVYAALEADAPWKLIVGNARHIKNVPGRKTDVKDAEWLATLVRNGLIRPSFVPPPAIRELRDLTRYRAALVHDRVREQNRVLKVLQTANVKLDGVASDAFGMSGMAIMKALTTGEATPMEMAQLARGRLRSKMDALAVALEAKLSPVHREMLKLALERVEAIERNIERVEEMIRERIQPHRTLVDRLLTIPGFDELSAAYVIAEIGPDMRVFPTEHHLASWAGVSPGNRRSAGKSLSEQTCKGNPHLKTLLCQLALAAAKTKGTYLKDKFYRLKARRGHGRAIIAIAHKLLTAAYKVMKHAVNFKELGEAYLDQRDKGRVVANLVKRIEALGYAVTLRGQEPAALPAAT
jgi:transposase